MARVLIVDDEKSIRRTLGEFLRDAGYDVAEADSAEQALEQLATGPFDVVVSDILLPRIDGMALLQRIHENTPETPVILMTGEPTAATAAEALRQGAADYLFKPITKAAILRVVAKAIRVKSLEEARCRLEGENRVHRENLERLVQERTAQLTVSEERARNLSGFNQHILDALTANICVLDEEGRILAVNAPWRNFAAANPPFPMNAEVGANYLEVCESVKEDPLALDAARGIRSVIRGERTEYSIEYPCHSPDTQRWFMMRVTRFTEGDSARLVVAHANITGRKLAEQRISDALSFSRAILESSPIGIATYQATGETVSANAALAEMLGGTREQVLAQNFRRLDSWRQSGLLAAAEQALATQAEQRLEVVHLSTFGKRLNLDCRMVPFSYANAPHLLVLVSDVTEQKLIHSKLLRAQRVEGIGSLASGIAHDLNNILTPIVMCAPMLKVEQPPDTRRELAQMIDSSAHRAVGIVKQLLMFARGNEGQKQPVAIRHLVRDLVKIARETFPRNIQVQEFCDSALWRVMGDATQLHQVLLNLCVNARDAMPAGGTLTLRADNVVLDDHFVSMHPEACAGAYVRIQVQDTGTGIPESVQAHIFESFFTTKVEGAGTGLGLTTTHGIVKDHKGFIHFTSAPGKGTQFEIHLPAVPEVQSGPSSKAGSSSIPRGHGELILIVDDEAPIRSATCRTLEGFGYRVLQAKDGIDALAQFSANAQEVRAVVTDCMMPLMDGVTLSRTLRRLSPATPIIISSGGLFGKSGEAALQSFEELGIRDILHKPHNADILLDALARSVRPIPPGTREAGAP